MMKIKILKNFKNHLGLQEKFFKDQVFDIARETNNFYNIDFKGYGEEKLRKSDKDIMYEVIENNY